MAYCTLFAKISLLKTKDLASLSCPKSAIFCILRQTIFTLPRQDFPKADSPRRTGGRAGRWRERASLATVWPRGTTLRRPSHRTLVVELQRIPGQKTRAERSASTTCQLS